MNSPPSEVDSQPTSRRAFSSYFCSGNGLSSSVRYSIAALLPSAYLLAQQQRHLVLFMELVDRQMRTGRARLVRQQKGARSGR